MPIGKKKNVISLMKSKPSGKILKDFVALRDTIYACRKLDKNFKENAIKGRIKCKATRTILRL